MKLILQIIVPVLLAMLLEQCASPTALTGGLKDTIPPSLLYSDPVQSQLSFKKQQLEFLFDENIRADKLLQELIITPTIDLKYTHVIKKNKLIIKFDEPFPDSTTFTFNFRAGVGDATENNPVKNFRLALSTGNYIDSLILSGTINDLLDNKPTADITVGLYPLTDTLDLLKNKPYYFTTAAETGNFDIQNIKAGRYILFSFLDDNNNLLFDPATEPYSVYPDTIPLTPSFIQDTIKLMSMKVNAIPLQLISARPTGHHFVVRYNKSLLHADIQIPDSSNSTNPAFQLSTDRSEIIIYNNDSLAFETDSILSLITVRDTLNQILTDSVYLLYRASTKKVKDWATTFSSPVIKNDTLRLNISSSKPIYIAHPEYMTISLDSTYQFSPAAVEINYNNIYKTNASIIIPFDTTSLLAQQRDSLTPDSSSVKFTNQSFSLTLAPRSLISIEQDTLIEPYTSIIKYASSSTAYGTLSLTVNTSFKSYRLDLISGQDKIYRSYYSPAEITDTRIKPGNYNIRVYIDANNNGRWEPANPWKQTTAEQIYNYPNSTDIRANWIISIEDITF
ncbi:MAG: hypothetical protein ACJAZM_002338 [Cyclobacteriaceae bacterium]|jgi:hypothetical protein